MSKRIRNLSTKGMAQYETRVEEFRASFQSACSRLNDIIDLHSSTLSDKERSELDSIKLNIDAEYDKCNSVLRAYTEFLNDTRTEDSLSRCSLVQSDFMKIKIAYNDFICKINQASCSHSDSKSTDTCRSNSSHRSGGSSTSTIRARKQAKAEAARTRALFAEKEAELKRQQAILEEQSAVALAAATRKKLNLDIDLKLLGEKKEAAAAEVEAEVFEKLSDDCTPHIQLPEKDNFKDPMQRCGEFVLQSNMGDNMNEQVPINPKSDSDTNRNKANDQTTINPTSDNDTNRNKAVTNNLDPMAPSFHPQLQTYPDCTSQTQVTDIAQYLLSKDLQMSRFYKFDDRPETFLMWKTSFKGVISDFQIKPQAELDLLIKWLGPTSTRQAINIRAANATSSKEALVRIWERLDERFGSPELIMSTIRRKLDSFPKLSDNDGQALYELYDIVSEVACVKQNPVYKTLFSYFDTSVGVAPIVDKLPHKLQERWVVRAANYKRTNNVPFPPFSCFVSFLKEMSTMRNDPSLYNIVQDNVKDNVKIRRNVSTRKTEVKLCPLHGTNHSINECRAFKTKSLGDRKAFLKENNLCFRCCMSNHKGKQCRADIFCIDCNSRQHPTALHVQTGNFNRPQAGNSNSPSSLQSGEPKVLCTQICGGNFLGKSCAKILLVNVFSGSRPQDYVTVYAIIDDQSNQSLAKPELLDLLGLQGTPHDYTLTSCNGTRATTGRLVDGLVVESFDKDVQLNLPPVLECDKIPNTRQEIPTPDVAKCYPHLVDIADQIPELQTDIQILLLLGRDFIEGHHVMDQRIGPGNTPYAQRLRLGWVVIGETCLQKIHVTRVNVNKTYVLSDGRSSLFKPCDSMFTVCSKLETVPENKFQYDPAFTRTVNDNIPSMSLEEKEFVKTMDSGFHKGPDNKWTAPLPFRSEHVQLPNNRPLALKRARLLHKSLLRDELKKKLMLEFMSKIFENGHAELAPDIPDSDQRRWYLPIFGVSSPKKPGKIRCVFDSSAKFDNVSLNDVLLTGPDLCNNLLGVLMRFRKEKVGVMADIRQMFYSFHVNSEHRNFLRFLWYQDNDPQKPMVDYRMTVHVFGNCTSPAVATYGLRKTVETADSDVKLFVNRDFYVDDGLTSLPTVPEAVDLLSRTSDSLSQSGLTIHKIVSNSDSVMKSFPSEVLASGLQDLNLLELPMQRSLGMLWNINTDSFTFSVMEGPKPYTRRGVLSIINSLFDPFGFISPVTIQGKLILRDLMSGTFGWDDHLHVDKLAAWENWKASLSSLSSLEIPRTYSTSSLSRSSKTEVVVCCDASQIAIAAVAYLITYKPNGEYDIGFLMGKAKVAPSSGHTIPRLELCAALLAAEMVTFIQSQLALDTTYRCYTDSKVVLGYLNNETRRFFTYVANRVERIRNVTHPKQWGFIPTHLNPADCATRGVPASRLSESLWLRGPEVFIQKQTSSSVQPTEFPLLDPSSDREVRIDLKALTTKVQQPLGSQRFSRFSSWNLLVRAIAVLFHIAQCFNGHSDMDCTGWHVCVDSNNVNNRRRASQLVICEIQRESFCEEIEDLKQGRQLSKSSPIANLCPFIDENGVLRVGGRLKYNSSLPTSEKNPIIIPNKHHVTTLIVRHHHEKVSHQGRHFTEGEIRSAGFWIVGGKRRISSVIHNCVMCKKLRGSLQFQQMANLPSVRTEEAPPFTFVGVDAFGPWEISSRKTRGGLINSKRWAIMFTCLSVRAVHIEVVDEMSSSAFINALRRFVATRGKVSEFRSDRGTNFVGAVDDLGFNAINVEDRSIKNYLTSNDTVWRFNPPHSSHMGGAWERMIGLARRILESMLSDQKTLTHDVLVTFLAEVCAIINARPLTPVSCDPDSPELLTPAMIITQKSDVDQPTVGTLDVKDLYRHHWKRVKHLADTFWLRWRKEYLNQLQPRKKWLDKQDNLCEGDLVLLRDKTLARNQWPLARISEVFPSEDGCVRSVKLKVVREGKVCEYVRPIVELVLLMKNE